jgi:hypothetical protein
MNSILGVENQCWEVIKNGTKFNQWFWGWFFSYANTTMELQKTKMVHFCYRNHGSQKSRTDQITFYETADFVYRILKKCNQRFFDSKFIL